MSARWSSVRPVATSCRDRRFSSCIARGVASHARRTGCQASCVIICSHAAWMPAFIAAWLTIGPSRISSAARIDSAMPAARKVASMAAISSFSDLAVRGGRPVSKARASCSTAESFVSSTESAAAASRVPSSTRMNIRLSRIRSSRRAGPPSSRCSRGSAPGSLIGLVMRRETSCRDRYPAVWRGHPRSNAKQRRRLCPRDAGAGRWIRPATRHSRPTHARW
ncbi:hypothetical protein D3C81_1185940 [compost metagenome]